MVFSSMHSMVAIVLLFAAFSVFLMLCIWWARCKGGDIHRAKIHKFNRRYQNK